MKTIQKFLYIFLSLLMIACSSESDYNDDGGTSSNTEKQRTVILYICGDNNISTYLSKNVTAITNGSTNLSTDCQIIAFVDLNNKTPYIAKIEKGQRTVVREYDEDFYAVSPDTMRNVMQYIVDNYPAKEYGLIMGGHGNGAIIMPDTVATNLVSLYAYGGDLTSSDGKSTSAKYINIPSMAATISNVKNADSTPLHFDFMFFDCCCMQNVETAYELRHCTDYFIAAASEVPMEGAPYATIAPILNTAKEDIGKEIIDHYINDTKWDSYGQIALAAVKTSELDALMTATKKALHSISYDEDDRLRLNRESCIYYYRDEETDCSPALHDIKNIMRINLSTEAYNEWLPYLDRTVVYKYMPTVGTSGNYWYSTSISRQNTLFTITNENYSGLSMIAPNATYDKVSNRLSNFTSLNDKMFQLQWCNDVDWHSLGW